jgi:hypothetical protein
MLKKMITCVINLLLNGDKKRDAYVKKMKILCCLFEKTLYIVHGAQVTVVNVVVDCIFLGNLSVIRYAIMFS